MYVYDDRTLFGLDRLALFPADEQARLREDRAAFQRRVDEAATLALDMLIEREVELWLGRRKKALLVTPCATDRTYPAGNRKGPE
jgi:hypothetical protein